MHLLNGKKTKFMTMFARVLEFGTMKSVAQASFKRRTIYEPNLILRLEFMKRLTSESIKIGKKNKNI